MSTSFASVYCSVVGSERSDTNRPGPDVSPQFYFQKPSKREEIQLSTVSVFLLFYFNTFSWNPTEWQRLEGTSETIKSNPPDKAGKI